MPVPYDSQMVTSLLRNMPPDSLAAVTPDKFRMFPAPVVLPGDTLREMIANEKQRRRRK